MKKQDSGFGIQDSENPSPVTRHPLAPALILAAALALAGCDYLPFGYTPIKDIIAAPASFEGKEVKIKGKVKNAVQLPGLKAYTLEDETGRMTITVVTEGQLPAANAEVALKGTVKSTMIVGGATLGLRIEEMKRLR